MSDYKGIRRRIGLLKILNHQIGQRSAMSPTKANSQIPAKVDPSHRRYWVQSPSIYFRYFCYHSCDSGAVALQSGADNTADYSSLPLWTPEILSVVDIG